MELSGVEHYREAALLLEEAKQEREAPTERAAWCLELAKVHMGLALVAATATDADKDRWTEVVGTSRVTGPTAG